MIKKIIAAKIVCAFLFVTGCSSNPATQTAINAKVASFFANKTVQQVGAGVLNIALSAGIEAGTQEASTGSVNGSQIASSAEYGAVALLRTLQGTPAAASPTAITAAIQTGSASPSVSAVVVPQVVAAVTQAVASGVAPSVANEQAAVGLSTSAATLAAKP
jgi:hypothetical protein